VHYQRSSSHAENLFLQRGGDGLHDLFVIIIHDRQHLSAA
jgi:hypothetical protein